MIGSYKKSLLFSIIFFVAFVIFSIMTKMVNLAEIGPYKSVVGLSEINKTIFDFFKTNKSSCAGLFCILVSWIQMISHKQYQIQ